MSALPMASPHPSATPPPSSENKQLSTGAVKESALATKPFKADVEEGESPKILSADASAEKAVLEDEALPAAAVKQEEDKDDDSTARDGDIYADAVLACSIENPESCLMCSG